MKAADMNQGASACVSCSSLDKSSMHPGKGDRHDECVNVGECLGILAKYTPSATAAHCPLECTRRLDITREERRLEAHALGREDDPAASGKPKRYGEVYGVKNAPIVRRHRAK